MDLIGFKKNNERYMKYLKEHIDNVIPFLGAGISVPFGYDTWQKFLEKLLNRHCCFADISQSEMNGISLLINSKNYMKAADEMDEVLPNFTTAICDEIRRIHDNEPFSLGKAEFLGEYLPMFPSGIFLTTNYDDVIEKILSSHFGKGLRIVLPSMFDERLGLKQQKGTATLYYLHGAFRDRDTVVLTNAHYDDIYGREITGQIKSNMRRLMAKKLRELNHNNMFLFIGCGMSLHEDRILKLLKEINRTALLDNYNYALMNIDDLGDADVHNRENELAHFNIRPIWYSEKIIGHEEAKKELFHYLLSERREEFDERKKKIAEKYEKIQEEYNKMNEAGKQLEKSIDSAEEIDVYKYPKKYYKGDSYVFSHACIAERHFITDKGLTYEMLDKVFELKEPDVKKNLHAICHEFNVKNVNNVLLVEIPDWAEIPDDEKMNSLEEAKFRLFSCVSFMDAMRIFYI